MLKKVLILILAYNAERHISKVLDRIPDILWANPEYLTDIVVIDDCSKDNTSKVARAYLNTSSRPIRLLRNAVNQGYGGNQKIGYTYAIEHGYDAVVMVHGDGQYPPEFLPEMIAPILRGEADAVFGSRMINKADALKGGMPYYKFAGNIILTWLQNLMLGSKLYEFHSGYRAYNVKALAHVPFQDNSNVFHFDTDIIIQFVDSKLTIKEIPIPTHYGDEVCHVNGVRYAVDVMLSTMLSRVQKLGILYAPKFDYDRSLYLADKSGFASSHTFALERVMDNSCVFDIGNEGHVASHLRRRGCSVTACSWEISDEMRERYDKGFACDLNHPDFTPLSAADFNVIMLLDSLEQVESPERFMRQLHAFCAESNPRIIITVGNVAFFIARFMLMLGQFNYSKTGTLAMRHRRLFTFKSLKCLLASTGFTIAELEGIPAPFPIVLGAGRMARSLLKLNQWLIKLSKGLFSYQIGVVVQPAPTLEILMRQAIETGDSIQ